MPESPVDSGRQSLMTFSEKKLLALNQIVDQSLSKAKAKQRKIKHKKALGSLIQSGTSNVNVGGGRLTTQKDSKITALTVSLVDSAASFTHEDGEMTL